MTARTTWGCFCLERKNTRVASRWLQLAFVVVFILALAKLQLGWVTPLVVPLNHSPHLAAFPLENEVEELPPIKYLQRFTHIIVSGPQRSGTTFVAGAIAKELEYRHLDETFKAILNVSTECASLEPQRNLTFECNGCWLSLFESEETLVAQRPQMSHLLHELPEYLASSPCTTPEDRILVIFMARHCLDVFRSQNKIYHADGGGWTCKFGRQIEWRNYRDSPQLANHVDLRDMICTIKQNAWKHFQRQRLSDNGVATLTLGYDLLKNSWLATAFEADEDKRTTFGPKTWMKDIVQ